MEKIYLNPDHVRIPDMPIFLLVLLHQISKIAIARFIEPKAIFYALSETLTPHIRKKTEELSGGCI